jgi:hypothetical protein
VKVKVPGVAAPYDSPEEALAEADELERLMEDEVGELRAKGRDADADRRADQYRKLIEAHRTTAAAALERQADDELERGAKAAARKTRRRAAERTSQPKDRPKPSRRQLAKKTLGKHLRDPKARRAGRARQQSYLGRSTRALRSGASGRVLRETGIGGATTSTTRFALQIFGIFVALALVIVLVENERPEGGPFSGLVDGLAKLVGLWVGPHDPFRPPWTGGETSVATTSFEELVPRPGRPLTTPLN